jgi:predicted TIM-barrel fold metal-dependent hydrolase
MGDKPDHPSHRTLIAARDRVLARHPLLRVIGAHLGSLEYDVTELAVRLERYANFAVDTSARMPDLLRQDRAKVRAFLLKFADRVLYGTDVVQRYPVSSMDEPERRAHLASMRQRYVLDHAYFSSDATTSRHGVDTEGLGLPPDVAAAIMGGNAREWYPGV